MIQHKQVTNDMRNILIISALLTTIGLLFIYSSSSVFALEKHASPSYFFKKQLVGLLLGLVALVCARLFPLNLLKKLAPLAFIGSLSITALTFIPSLSSHIHGSSRWLSIGGFSFQPSELLKIGIILYLASFLTKKEYKKNSFTYCYLPFLIIMSVTSLVLLKQPDFGLTVTLLLTACIMLFIAQIPLRYLGWTIVAALPGMIILILMRSYRLKRILTFLNPWNDPRGAGFQIIQSLIAIGSGGFWGVGIGQSKQKFFYLPMQHTDFIFSIIAEETGFVGCSILVLFFSLFTYFGFRVAARLHDNFSMLACTGFVALISLETVINISVATGLIPTKGIGMPFVSYGNTALVCTLAMIGLMMNMASENRHQALTGYSAA